MTLVVDIQQPLLISWLFDIRMDDLLAIEVVLEPPCSQPSLVASFDSQ